MNASSSNGHESHLGPEEPRIKRPQPERTAPNRAFTGVFGSGSAGSDDVIDSSVEAAYRVINAYFDFGRRAAEQFGTQGSPPSAGSAPRPSAHNPLEQLIFGYAATMVPMMTVGFQILADLAGQAQAKAPPAAAHPATPQPAPPVESVVGSLSTAMFRLAFTLRPGERGSVEGVAMPEHVLPCDLKVTGLKPAPSSFPELEIETGANAAPRFLVSVPYGQPTGHYNWLLSDKRGVPLGALSLTVLPLEAGHG